MAAVSQRRCLNGLVPQIGAEKDMASGAPLVINDAATARVRRSVLSRWPSGLMDGLDYLVALEPFLATLRAEP
jgi:hypothetical protein